MIESERCGGNRSSAPSHFFQLACLTSRNFISSFCSLLVFFDLKLADVVDAIELDFRL